jgi:hypothetical protein
MNFLIKFYNDRPGRFLSMSIGLLGLSRVLVWPVPGSEIMACACHRQAGLVAWLDLCYPPSRVGMHLARTSRAWSFPVTTVFSEVSSLLRPLLDLSSNEEHIRVYRDRASRYSAILGLGFPGVLFVVAHV